MKFKIASMIQLILALTAIYTMIYASIKNFPFAGPVGYVIIFILIPLVSAFGLFRQKTWAVLLSLLFFLPQSINYIEQQSSFIFTSPISLNFTLGTMGEGTFYIINIFALCMVIFMFVLLHYIFRIYPDNALKTDDESAI